MPRFATPHTRGYNLSIVWLGIMVLLVYMGLAPINAALFSLGVVLHASLGLSALRALNPRIPVSLTVFLGPSLVLGGAFSFVLFQAVGRGAGGFATTTSAGAVAATFLLRNKPTSADEDWTQRTFFGVLTVAALVLTSEFTELIPAVFALALIFLSIVYRINRSEMPITRFALLITASVLLAWSVMIRHEYWWIISDDYQYLEVVARHITAHGVFEKWGVLDLSRYHWLSYGWSGILDGFSGSPEPLVTLTRAMPTIYSISMASSLLSIGSTLANQTKITTSCLGTALLIAALNPVDWSGTSTASAYPAIAGTVAVGALALRQQISATRRLAGHLVFLPIIIFTKLPSVIAFVLGVLALELILVLRQKRRSHVLLFAMLLILCPIGALSTLILLRELTQTFSITVVNPWLGQISWFGPIFAALALLLQKTPIWFLAIAIIIASRPSTRVRAVHESQHLLVVACLAFVPMAVVLDMIVTHNVSSHTYFSGPVWLLSSLAILGVDAIQGSSNEPRIRQRLFAAATAVVAIGIAYQYGGELLWETLVNIAPEGRKLQVVLLQFVTSDTRTATSLMFTFLLTAGMTFRCKRLNNRMVLDLRGMVLGLLLLSALLLAPEAAPSRNPPRSAAELETYLGSAASRSVGNWLRKNTSTDDLIATNHLRDFKGNFLSDYSMALWSNREFLVLGPRFGGGTNEVREAVRLSDSFAMAGTDQAAQHLQMLGVKWFVVDTELTNLKSWSRSSDVGVQFGAFRVLRIDD